MPCDTQTRLSVFCVLANSCFASIAIMFSFQADIKRMLRNCKEYNAENTIFYKSAGELAKFLKERWGYDVESG